MKKTLMILGGIFAVLILAGVVIFSILAVKGSALDEESKAYVDDVTPIILADLNKETLFQYASDELINSASEEEFDKIFGSGTLFKNLIEKKFDRVERDASIEKKHNYSVEG